MTQPKTTYLKDYKPYPYFVKSIELFFILGEEETLVTSKTSLKIKENQDFDGKLAFYGELLELRDIKISGAPLAADQYQVSETALTLLSPPAEFELETTVAIKPQENTRLEGLYKSSGNFATQCEPEGFRKITYYPDRPDVLTKFTVTITAERERYPVLLSNGNRVAEGDNGDGRHWVKWEDPFDKPSYLFALVAGDFGCLADTYKTSDGRNVKLEIYAHRDELDKCAFAMGSLKRSMAWDEEKFGLTCDLDEFKIVSIRDFNFGAMENKGLNIFNSALILAKPEITSDAGLQRIERVVAHEYFHNWTGNRVTCRDWFQLCLKEGLTVYRDSEFGQDMGSAAVVRIEDVKFLRAMQFAEDAGPMAHPPRPDRFMEINNFYTLTVYEKGAEVVRMLRVLLGYDGFRKGIDRYFEKFDGMAVTQEDFVQVMAEASGRNLDQFMTWYTQAGTPSVQVEGRWNASDNTYTLRVQQTTPATPGQPDKKPLHIPMVTALLGENGRELPLANGATEQILEITQETQEFKFDNIPEHPVPSLFRGFSAPVINRYPYSNDDLQFLLRHDQDPFSSWEAGQSLMTRNLIAMINEGTEVDRGVLQALDVRLSDSNPDQALLALALGVPSFQVLAQKIKPVPVEKIYQARKTMREKIAETFSEKFLELYRQAGDNDPQSFASIDIAKRMLRGTCLSYLASLDGSQHRDLVTEQFEKSVNMTDILQALRILANLPGERRSKELDAFYAKWQHEPEVIDSWFSAQACSEREDTFEVVQDLVKHDGYDLKNPNRMRSVLGGFCKANPVRFHRPDGRSYQFCADYVIKLNSINPQMGSGLARSFQDWRLYPQDLQGLMSKELERIKNTPELSPDVFEIVSKFLK